MWWVFLILMVPVFGIGFFLGARLEILCWRRAARRRETYCPYPGAPYYIVEELKD